MGRPPMNAKPTIIRLTDETRRRIEALVGPNRMAVFIRTAVEDRLAKLEREARRQSKPDPS